MNNHLKRLIETNPNTNNSADSLREWSKFVGFFPDTESVVLFRQTAVYDSLRKIKLIDRETLELLSDSFIQITNIEKEVAVETVLVWADAQSIPILPESLGLLSADNTEIISGIIKVQKKRVNECADRSKEFAVKTAKPALNISIMKQAQIDSLMAHYQVSKESDSGITQEGIRCFEKAVELGYKGDYIDIADVYFYGSIYYHNIERDYEKAREWYERYLSDFEVEITGTEKLFTIYYNLGEIYFNESINKKKSDILRDDYIRQGMSYWRKALLVAKSLQDELWLLCIRLSFIGRCFKSGTFKENDSCNTVVISADYEYAFEAFSLCLIYDEDDIDALYMLADMYINGLFVKQDIFKGEEYYWRVLRYISQWVNLNEDSDRKRMVEEIHDYFECNYRISEVSKYGKDEWDSHVYDFYIDEEKAQCLNLGRINREIRNMDTWRELGEDWKYWRNVLQRAISIIDADDEYHKMMKCVEDLLYAASNTGKILSYDDCMNRIEKLGEVSYDALKMFMADIMQQGYSVKNSEDVYFEAICNSLSDIAEEAGNHIQYDILFQAFSDKKEHEQYVDRAMKLLKNKGIVIDDLPVRYK